MSARSMRIPDGPGSRSAAAVLAESVLSSVSGPFSLSDVAHLGATSRLLSAMARRGLLEEGPTAPSASGPGIRERVYAPSPESRLWMEERRTSLSPYFPPPPPARRRRPRPRNGRTAAECLAEIDARSEAAVASAEEGMRSRPKKRGGFRGRISEMLRSRPDGERRGCGRGRPLGSSHPGEDFSGFIGAWRSGV